MYIIYKFVNVLKNVKNINKTIYNYKYYENDYKMITNVDLFTSDPSG